MLDSIIKRINDLHCHDQVIIFSIPISICSWLHVNDRLGPLIAAQLDATGAEVIVTACPLCKKAIGRGTKSEVRDLAEIVVAAIK